MRRVLLKISKAAIISALVIVLGIFSTRWLVHEEARTSVPLEVVAALRNAARICLENPLEELLIQKTVVQSAQPSQGKSVTRNELLHKPADEKASFSERWESEQRLPFKGVVVAYTFFALPLAKIVVEVDQSGGTACHRSNAVP